jgi:predicted unusual protein kinase regulating ubiquinone biosynthesis (AarF/ABC1/UbiB family)
VPCTTEVVLIDFQLSRFSGAVFWALACLLASQTGWAKDPLRQQGIKEYQNSDKFREIHDEAQTAVIKKLPGGLYKAPGLRKQVEQILNDLRVTGIVDSGIIPSVFIAADPSVNGSIQVFEHRNSEVGRQLNVKEAFITVTAGYFDFLSQPERYAPNLPPHLLKALRENPKGILASTLAHELGHTLTTPRSETGRVYDELEADEWSVRLLDAAGYDPISVKHGLELMEHVRAAQQQEPESALAKLFRFQDEHPAPALRIANIDPLIEKVRRERTAKQVLGMSATSVPYHAPEQIDRSKPEEGPRSSRWGFNRELERHQFSSLPLREKLRYLENFLPTHPKADAEVKIAVVEQITQAGKNLQTTEDLDAYLAMVSRFIPQVSDAPLKVKKASRDLLNQVFAAQVQAAEKEIGEPLTQRNLRKWIGEVDVGALNGVLLQNLNRATSLETVREILDAFGDHGHRLSNRFGGSTKARAETTSEMYHRAVTAALRITGDLEAAYDFLQKHIPPGDLNTGKADLALARLVTHALEHPEVKWGNFAQRLIDPHTQLDKNYSDRFVYQVTYQDVWRGGKPVMVQGTLTPNQAALIREKIRSAQREIIFNAAIRTHYTLAETLDLLESRCSSNCNWSEVRARTLQTYPAKHRQDLTSNLAILEHVLSRIDPRGSTEETHTARQQSLVELRNNVGNLYAESIADIGQKYMAPLPFTARRKDSDNPPRQLPNLDSDHFLHLPVSKRAEIISILFPPQPAEEPPNDHRSLNPHVKLQPSVDEHKDAHRALVIAAIDSDWARVHEKFAQDDGKTPVELESIAAIANYISKQVYPDGNPPFRESQSGSAQNLTGRFSDSHWSRTLERSIQAEDPVEGVLRTLNIGKDWSSDRLVYMLLTHNLRKVTNAEQMRAIASILDVHLVYQRDFALQIGMDLFSGNKNRSILSLERNREQFFDLFVEKMGKFEAWPEPQPAPKNRQEEVREAQRSREDRSLRWTGPNGEARMFAIKAPNLRGSHGVEGWRDSDELLFAARRATPWSTGIDNEIRKRVRERYFGKTDFEDAYSRILAAEDLSEIRSPRIRDEAYQEFLARFGYPSQTREEKKARKARLREAYKEAQKVWGKKAIEEVSKSANPVEGMLKAHDIWLRLPNRASQREKTEWGQQREFERDLRLLITLRSAYSATTDDPMIAELDRVFPEKTAHRDVYIDEYIKQRSLSVEEIENLELKKSKNQSSELHKVGKTLLEATFEFSHKLSPSERAELALYLAGRNDKLSPELDKKVKHRFHGSESRTRSFRKYGAYFSPAEAKEFLQEQAEPSRAIAYQMLFIGEDGIAKDPAAAEQLLKALIMRDPNMPAPLQRLLTHYFRAHSPLEQGLLLSKMLAKKNDGSSNGPEVLKLMIQHGGVTPAKAAQLVDSLDLKLPEEYRQVVHNFKSDAQDVQMQRGIEWIRARLAPEKFAQIAHFDGEVGSGGVKVGYLATLTNGKRVILKVAKEFILGDVVREFEVIRSTVDGAMADPELRRSSLPAIEQETRRLVTRELDFKNEVANSDAHREAINARPLWVKWFGGGINVLIPKVLNDWSTEGLTVEEFAEGKTWDALPDRAFFGWSKEKLAKAILSEIVNEVMAFANPKEHIDGKVILDVDPHENNFATHRGWLRNSLVSFDFGQSERVAPEALRDLFLTLYEIQNQEFDRAAARARSLMDYPTTGHEMRFAQLLRDAHDKSSNAISSLTAALQQGHEERILLKPERMFFQKMLATATGLTHHISDRNYLERAMRKAAAARGMALQAIVKKARDCKESFSMVSSDGN